jgi:hypothetical protein
LQAYNEADIIPFSKDFSLDAVVQGTIHNNVNIEKKFIMRKFLCRKALLATIWLLFIFALFQTAGFILFTFTSAKFIGSYGYPDGLFIYHSSLNYIYKPGFKGYFDGGQYKDIEIRINNYGFRDDPFSPRSYGRRRIVFIGDSIVFGAGVWEKDRFTEQLLEEKIIRDAGIEVLNLGVNSYNFGH